jgi:hypothetical protein
MDILLVSLFYSPYFLRLFCRSNNEFIRDRCLAYHIFAIITNGAINNCVNILFQYLYRMDPERICNSKDNHIQNG